MPRPGKAARVRRIELWWADDDPLLAELAQEARLRGVALTQQIHDLLRSRYLLRDGQSLADLLWIPGSAMAESAADTPAPDAHRVSEPSATAAADAWSDQI